MDEEETDRDRVWHVTKGVPIAPMFAMLVYVVTHAVLGAWFVKSMDARVEAAERAQAQLQIQVAPLGERLTRVEEKLVAVQAGTTEIKMLLQTPGKQAR